MSSPVTWMRARIACWRSIGRSRHSRSPGAIDPADLARMRAAFDGMPALTRSVFVMHRFDDLAYDRIAVRLGIGIDEVEAQIVVALTHLRRAMDDDH